MPRFEIEEDSLDSENLDSLTDSPTSSPSDSPTSPYVGSKNAAEQSSELRLRNKGAHKRQILTSLSDREKGLRWMRLKHSQDASKIPGTAVLKFPDLFRYNDHGGRLTCMRRSNR